MKKTKVTIKHAFLMVRREIVSYLLLSVTILLSFSFLLGFFMFSDSAIYNSYKEYLGLPPTLSTVGRAGAFDITSMSPVDYGEYQTKIRQNILLEQLEKMPDTYYFRYFTSTALTPYYGDDNNSVIPQLYFVPNEFNGFFGGNDNYTYVEFVSGRNVLNNPYEILIDEGFYKLLSNNKEDYLENEVLTLVLPLTTKEGITFYQEFVVVGIVSNYTIIDVTDSCNTYYVSAFLSRELISEYNLEYVEEKILIKSERMPEIVQLTENLNLTNISTYRFLERINTEIRNHIFMKGIATIILFFLLGINLYSSFNNVLKERRFEIGVKRALGASKKDIIYQFFLEGLIIMLLNSIVSVILVLNIATIYKFIQMFFYYSSWTIYITLHSLFLYAFSVLFLSVFFSLPFTDALFIELATENYYNNSSEVSIWI